ncbi:predicted protein [Uncinocarpus reesii 1704]|uniref:Uncharacterized protein n=1 Tax=Uncinocarpus reesii (strain UAMH 1704) TaxID=336963 RepID=C4JR69_UNCRE|nr:uncharacterized protein UREG_03551 [Uncinocarpus reesii 1704]EEP78705.1 predicted protein [Uncinocarpus reesii 1704]
MYQYCALMFVVLNHMNALCDKIYSGKTCMNCSCDKKSCIDFLKNLISVVIKLLKIIKVFNNTANKMIKKSHLSTAVCIMGMLEDELERKAEISLISDIEQDLIFSVSALSLFNLTMFKKLIELNEMIVNQLMMLNTQVAVSKYIK